MFKVDPVPAIAAHSNGVMCPMKSPVRVAVIGGGVVGCSVLYHLTKAGWSDVVLIEKDELTCGSTWHAAGGMHTLNSDPNVAKLQDYTIRLYEEIEEISGQSCGIHLTGGLMLAGTPERMDYLKAMHATGRYLGMHTELISADEAADMYPLMDKRHFIGALFDPMEGHVDPVRCHPCVCQGGPARRRGGLSRHAGGGSHAAARRRLGRGHGRRHDRRRSMSSTPAGCGRARSAAWSGSSCRCWRWSTCT